MSFPTDLEIARSVTPRPIIDIARELGIADDELELYGPTKAKVTLEAITRLEAERPRGKYVVVTAITPTPLGEGKSTTSVGLAQGLNHIGVKAAVNIRQPSLGPGLRDQGWRGRWRLQPGHPDGGLQPPPDRRRPCHRGGAQPGRRVPRQQPPPQEPARDRSARHPVAEGPRHQRPGAPSRRHRPGRTRGRRPARDGVRDHGRLRGDGGPGARDRPVRPACPARADRHGDRHGWQGDHRRRSRGRRRDDRPAARRDQAEPAPDAGGRTGLRPRRPVRQHRPRQQLDHRRPAGARRPTTSSAPRPASGPTWAPRSSSTSSAGRRA